MKKHILWMVIGCTLPLLLVFFAPVLGLSSSLSTFIFIVAMFACHLLMPMHHHRENAQQQQQQKQNSEPSKNIYHEHH